VVRNSPPGEEEQRLHRPKRCPQQVLTGVVQVNATPSGAVPNERVAAPLSPQVHPPPAGAPVAAYIPWTTPALQTNCYYKGRYTEQELNPPRQVLAELSLLYLESKSLPCFCQVDCPLRLACLQTLCLREVEKCLFNLEGLTSVSSFRMQPVLL
jgi:hypothetical protein